MSWFPDLLQFASMASGLGTAITIWNISYSCRACLLFAQIYEVKRVQISGPKAWCTFCCLVGLITGLVSFFMLASRLTQRFGIFKMFSRHCKCFEGCLCCTSSLCTALCFTSAVVITIGFRSWCSSMKHMPCSHTAIKMMDWRMFEPRYSNCFGEYQYLLIAQGSSWCSFVVWFLMLVAHRQNFPTKKEWKKTSG